MHELQPLPRMNALRAFLVSWGASSLLALSVAVPAEAQQPAQQPVPQPVAAANPAAPVNPAATPAATPALRAPAVAFTTASPFHPKERLAMPAEVPMTLEVFEL